MAESNDLKMIEEENGQMVFVSASTDTRQHVVQSTSFVYGRQDLTLNEAKLIRLIIMQVGPDDDEIKPYYLSARDYAKIIGNEDPQNAYHRMSDMCNDLMQKRLEIRYDNGSWVKYSWVSMCAYDAGHKVIMIKLNDALREYFIGLTGRYTQYQMLDALCFRSVYALRLYEMILGKAKKSRQTIPQGGVHAVITVDEIRDACSLYKTDESGKRVLDPKTKKPVVKFAKMSQFKAKVVDIAMREINSKIDDLHVSYTDVKNGRSITAFDFFVQKIAVAAQKTIPARPKKTERYQSKHNTFNDFEQNQYDFDALEKQLLESQGNKN